jgi:endoribonuclease Dicer
VQEELLDKAIDGNTIVYLGTGSGKTYIAVMLIKVNITVAGSLDKKEGGKKMRFLFSLCCLQN